MRYRLGIETTASDHWIAWVLDLPGCYSSGHTRAAVISNAGAAIAAYYQWISHHRHEQLFDDPYMDIHVTEVFQTSQAEPGIETKAFFEEDRPPLDDEGVAGALGLLAFTHADLVTVAGRAAPQGKASKKGKAESSPGSAILKQVAADEWGYLDKLGLAFPRSKMPADPLKAVEKIHKALEEALPTLSGDGRVVTRDGEMWSARKLVRRTLWLERDRAQQISRMGDQ